MKLVVVVVDRDRAGEVTALLDRDEVTGYSLFPEVLGRGETGAHLGTRAFPGENAMVLALITAGQATGLTEELRELKRSFRPGQGLKAFALHALPLV